MTTRDAKCFTDGQQMSSTSRFLRRIQPDKLYLQLHTFIFRQVHSTQLEVSGWRSPVCVKVVRCLISSDKNRMLRDETRGAGFVQMEAGEPKPRTSGPHVEESRAGRHTWCAG
ncbi:hypothetical protein QTP70_029057 [Hemibagrus guttatus]|uniref:Uncharacterized protein n=1 Tax=Hemibagrus guttatus TaxID=175788 RepID=A0AAE0PX23_9TELE|nr:hypothetical protein QTP70_029057 [Hemibagrus guttatus]